METAIEASLYDKGENGRVNCRLCSFRCNIAPGKRGVCGVRENREGTLYTLVYNRLIARHVDPIEKKPLFHFLPGSRSYSIATVGCNFRCLHCQNSEISQMPRDHGRIAGQMAAPEDIVASAVASGSESISYTYTEPTIFYEYARDTALLAREKGLKNVFVTNGYMTPECLEDAKRFLDAANVDVKSFKEETYKKVCGAKLKPVLESIEKMRSLGIWVEVTTLVIPTINDSETELRDIAKWMVSIDKAMPWHISAFHPSYKLMDVPSTPVSILDRAREIGFEEGLKYVYTGNAPGDDGESTRCPGCKVMLIRRFGFDMREDRIKDGTCPDCKIKIDGVWW